MKNVTRRVITTILAAITVFAGTPGISSMNVNAANWHEAENDTRLSKFEHELYNESLRTIKSVTKNGGDACTKSVNYGKYNIKEEDAKESLKKVLSLLKHNHPELLFWSSTMHYRYTDDRVWVYFSVLPEFRSNDSSNEYADKGKINNGTTALRNADNIIRKYANDTDYDKIKGYIKEISDYTDYNYDAANNSDERNYASNSGAWNIYWLFDGNPGTKVVCEGYAKGFQYLMDNTVFDDPSFKCKSVSGTSSAGPHMWNIVTIGNKNYLVDVTWYDATQNEIYALGADDKDHIPNNNTAYTASELTLSDTAYDPTNQIVKEKLSFSGNVTLSGIYGDKLSSFTSSYTGSVTDKNGNVVNGSWSLDPSEDGSTAMDRFVTDQTVKVRFKADKDTDRYKTLQADAKLVILKKDITVKIKDAKMTVGQALPTFAIETPVTGLVGSDTINDLAITFSTESDGKTSGEYAITGASASEHYNVTIQDGTLTVNEKVRKNLTAATEPKIKVTYGDPLSSGHISGKVIDNSGKTVSGAWTFDSSVNTSEIVDRNTVNNTCKVKFIPSENVDDYNTLVKEAVIDLKKKPVTVTAKSYTMTEGESMPSFEIKNVSVGTLVDGDLQSDLRIVLTSTATGKAAGSYKITGTSFSDYYDVTVVPGTLTVKEKAKVTPTVTEKPEINITYGQKITASSISGGKASYGNDTVQGTFSLSKDNDLNKIYRAGSYTVNGIFTPADGKTYNTTDTGITVNVAKKPVTIKIDDKTVTQSDVMPVFTASTNIPLVGNDVVGNLVTISCSARDTDTAGTYVITGTVNSSASDYSVTVKNGMLTVNKKKAPVIERSDVTIKTVPSVTGIYGNLLSTFNISDGAVADNAGKVVAGTWSITDADRTVNRVNADNAVNLVFTPADTKKYKTASASVKLTINKRPVTVKADNITRKAGEQKELTYHITNGSLVSGDTESALGITLKASNTVDKEGVYDISGTYVSDWYNVTINSGKLTITAAPSQTDDKKPDDKKPSDTAAYTISYSYNGGNASNPASYTKDTETFTLVNPVRNGYTFTGWTGSNGTTPQTNVAVKRGTTGDLYFIANWAVSGNNTSGDSQSSKPDNNTSGDSQPSKPAKTTAETYYITYNYDGGVAFGNPATYTKDTTFTLVNPVRNGYTFTGWSRTGDSFATCTMTIAKGTTGDITFTAHWVKAEDNKNDSVSTTNQTEVVNDIDTEDDTDIDTEDDTDVTLPEGKITKLYAGSHSVGMKYKKVSVKGKKVKYQVAIKKAYAKKWKKSTTSNVKKTFKGLKAGTTYWVSVRPYVTVDGERIYGEWAKTLIKKTK